MPNVTEAPVQVGVVSHPVGVSVFPEETGLVARVLETQHIATERREIISVERSDLSPIVFATGAQGPRGASGGGGGSGGIETYIAGASVNGHRVVVTDGLGRAIHADVSNPAHANMAMKITLGAAVLGDEVQVQFAGRVTEPSWSWTPGGTIYVGANGILTQTIPTAPGSAFSKPVAVAETATRILLVQEPPTMLT